MNRLSLSWRNIISSFAKKYLQENIEQSLDELLEEFRSGHMRALTDNQLEKMRELKREHERVSNMHIATFEMWENLLSFFLL